jgi:hypothetical protein
LGIGSSQRRQAQAATERQELHGNRRVYGYGRNRKQVLQDVLLDGAGYEVLDVPNRLCLEYVPDRRGGSPQALTYRRPSSSEAAPVSSLRVSRQRHPPQPGQSQNLRAFFCQQLFRSIEPGPSSDGRAFFVPRAHGLPPSVVGLNLWPPGRKAGLDAGAIPSRRSSGGRVSSYPGGDGLNPSQERMPERAGETKLLLYPCLWG